MPPPRAPAVYVPAVIPVYNWTGCYVGANAGGVWESDTTPITLTNPTGGAGGAAAAFAAGAIPNSFTYDRASWLAGGQVGCNFQFSAFVVGAETDFDGTGLNKGQTINTAVPTFFAATSSVNQKMGWIGTTRARAGAAFDNVLVYLTGGVAYANVSDSYSFNNVVGGGPVLTSGSDSTTRFGWTAGGGAEFAYGPWIFRTEALYYDLGNHTLSAACTLVGGAPCAAPNTIFNANFENKGVMARAGVSFKFAGF